MLLGRVLEVRVFGGRVLQGRVPEGGVHEGRGAGGYMRAEQGA